MGKVKIADETYKQIVELALKSGLTEMPVNIASLKALHNAEYGFTERPPENRRSPQVPSQPYRARQRSRCLRLHRRHCRIHEIN